MFNHMLLFYIFLDIITNVLQRAQAQSEKLGRMVEDLHDSETKLSKLLEQYHNHGISDEVISV